MYKYTRLKLYPSVLLYRLDVKILGIVWTKKKGQSVILCEGRMHLLIAVVVRIGKLCRMFGHWQFLVSLYLNATWSASIILFGKDLSYEVHALKSIYKALHNRFLNTLCTATYSHSHQCPRMYQSLPWCSGMIKKTFKRGEFFSLNQYQKNYSELKSSRILKQTTEHWLPLLNYFIIEVRLVTLRLWDDFPTKASDLPKLLNKLSREGYWILKTMSSLPMLPASNRLLTLYVWACRHCKYIVCLLMLRSFIGGLFIAELGEEKFNIIWHGYCSETTKQGAQMVRWHDRHNSVRQHSSSNT